MYCKDSGITQKINETYIYKKGEEKGYFEFGGSTIVLLFKKNTIKLDDDIYKNSQENIETISKVTKLSQEEIKEIEESMKD